MAPPSDSPLLRPASLRELFFAFTWLALQGFGGVLPVAQRELVERHRWLTREQFVEMLAVSQVLPGPNIVNLALMFGDRVFGVRGAFTALAGMLLAPLVVVLALTALYGHYAQVPAVTGALRGMGTVAAGLVISTALKLLTTLKASPLGRPIALMFATLTFLATAWLRWPLVWVIAGLGVVAIAVAWKRLRS
jgi:chromate transporter